MQKEKIIDCFIEELNKYFNLDKKAIEELFCKDVKINDELCKILNINNISPTRSNCILNLLTLINNMLSSYVGNNRLAMKYNVVNTEQSHMSFEFIEFCRSIISFHQKEIQQNINNQEEQEIDISKLFITELNKYLRIDTFAIRSFFEQEVEANEQLAYADNILLNVDDGIFHLRPIGLINGLLSCINNDKIIAIYDKDEILIGFDKYKKE